MLAGLALAPVLTWGALAAVGRQAVPTSGEHRAEANTDLVVVTIQRTFEQGVEMVGKLYVGPTVTLRAPFQVFPVGASVRPIALSLELTNGKGLAVGRSDGLWFRGETSSDPIAMESRSSLPVDCDWHQTIPCRDGYRLSPKAPRSWGEVAEVEDVEIEVYFESTGGK